MYGNLLIRLKRNIAVYFPDKKVTHRLQFVKSEIVSLNKTRPVNKELGRSKYYEFLLFVGIIIIYVGR